MDANSFDALIAYGWSERVAALYHSHPASSAAGPARVVRIERAMCAVVDCSGAERLLALSVPVAVGDWVVASATGLEGVLPRWSALERQDPESGRPQLLASNVDIVLITIPADRPSAARAERELTIAWESGARPVVVVTKSDLARQGFGDALASRLVGTEVVFTSADLGTGLEELRALLTAGSTAVLLGPSGAGKSTLTNALLGERRQAIGAVRADDRRGRHTTSSRQLLALPGGGVIIDTPGLRSLGLLTAEAIDEVFPDVDAYARSCRFRDCHHRSEPGCAVLSALRRGELTAERLASYLKLVREAAAEERRSDPMARRSAQRLWKQRAKEARQHPKYR